MSLRTVIDAYRANLPPGDLEHFRVDALDRIGVPVVFACHRQSDGAQFDAFGYGATEEQALVGVLGELTENAQADTILRGMERVTGSYRDLAADPRRIRRLRSADAVPSRRFRLHAGYASDLGGGQALPLG